jgi:hypothetical protein
MAAMNRHLLIIGIPLWTQPGWTTVTVEFANFGLDANNDPWSA